jgi:3-oxoacyl-[acyl-carrier protein] reductase
VSKHLTNSFIACGDVSEFATASTVVEKSINLMGGLDVLICNVGSGRSALPGAETDDDWKNMFRLNFYSAVNCITAAKQALTQSQGAVVCISSICSLGVIQGAPITYSVAKSALNSYVRSVSQPLGHCGIRINAVLPGNVYFPESIWSKKLVENPTMVRSTLDKEVPLQRFATISEIAEAVAFLASSRSSFTTGALLTVDGGQTKQL